MAWRGLLVSLAVVMLAAGGLYWSRTTQEPAAALVLPSPEAIDRALSAGEAPSLTPSERAYLELHGYTFTPADPRSGLARVSGRLRCATIRTDRWSPLPGLEYTGRLGLHLPAGRGRLTLLVGDTMPLLLRLALPAGQTVPVEVEPVLAGPGNDQVPPDYWLEAGDPFGMPQRVRRVTVRAEPARGRVFALELGRRAPRVFARLDGFEDGAVTARACAAPLGAGPWLTEAELAAELPLGDARLFGTGWFGIAGEGPDAGARLASGAAAVLVPVAAPGGMDVRLVAAPAVQGLATVSLAVNGLEQASQVMDDAWGEYHWRVPAGAWVAGTNELLFVVAPVSDEQGLAGGERRELGMAVQRIVIARAEDGGAPTP
ncbi:MAG: hypothetical protein AB7O67_09300 [Vicinamibacterales bacterium]